MDLSSLKQKQEMSNFVTKKLHNDSWLKLNCSEIPAVDEYKFLGIIFQKKTKINSLLEIPKN